MNAESFIGVDVGSISTNLVLLNRGGKIKEKLYKLTGGNPVQAVFDGLLELARRTDYPPIGGVGVTGSGRFLAGRIMGADLIKNEITAHAAAAVSYYKDVRTVVEIGGQDSKLILLQNGLVQDFSMNTVCAAGTGAFLEQQATRFGLKITELGQLALLGKEKIHIAGRCAVFAESDLIHKQQAGCSLEDLAAGLCRAMARNYHNNVVRRNRLKEPAMFQGGVAANPGMKNALEEELGLDLIVPKHHEVMGALGVALLARKRVTGKSKFPGYSFLETGYKTYSHQCQKCSNQCDLLLYEFGHNNTISWGGKCPEAEKGKAT